MCSTAQPDRISILHHEAVGELQIRSGGGLRKLSEAPLRKPAEPAREEPDLRFVAFGRDFQLVLQSNDALTQRLPVALQDALEGVELYRGRMTDVEGSWARISRSGSEVSGLIFDGSEYFAIDSFEHVADKLLTQGEVEGAVIYRLHDTVGLVGDEVLEPEATSSARTAARATVPQHNIAPMSAVVLGQQIDIGVVGDFEFAQLVRPPRAADSMIGLINIVDGIFLEGLGVHLNLVELQSYDAEPDPFGSSDPGVLLGQLGTLKNSTDAFRPLGLLHLFTGRDLDDLSSSRETLGVANIGTLCDPRFGVSLTQSSGGSAIDAVVAAHEIGHNFGAPHDAEPGSACAAAPAGMLMDASFSGSTEFSQCSIDQIRIEIAGAACMRPLLPADMTLWLLSEAPPPVVEPDVNYAIDIAIENTSGVDAVDVRLIVEAPTGTVVLADRRGAVPDNCEASVVGQPYVCYWSEFSDGERLEGSIRFRGRTAGPATIDVAITSLTESDSTGDSLHFEVDVLPYVNLAASVDPPALTVRPDEPRSVTMIVRNIGTEPAHQVVAWIRGGEIIDFLGASLGPCEWDDNTYPAAYNCPVGTVAPGASIAFEVDFRSRAGLSAEQLSKGSNIGIRASSLEPERTIDRHDNSFFAALTFGESIGDLVLEQFARPTAFVGETIIVSVHLRNDGPDTIQDVLVDLLELSGSAAPRLERMTAAGASCQLPLSEGDLICDISQIALGEEVTLTFSITASSTGDIRFRVGSEMWSDDPNVGNNSGETFITVLPQPPAPAPAPTPSPPPAQASTGGGGGGGALDPLLLPLLGALVIVVRRRAAVSNRLGRVGKVTTSTATTKRSWTQSRRSRSSRSSTC